MEHLTTQDVLDAGLADWRKLAQRFHARFRVADTTAGAAFLSDAVQAAAGLSLTDHLEATLAPRHVDLRVATDLGGDGVWVTTEDVTLARALSEVAARRGLAAAPGEVTQVEMGLDTAHRAALAPFWAVVLTGTTDGVVEDTVFDPTGRMPSIWFQQTEPHEVPRQRWHPDVWVPPEVADARIAAAVAAGGAVVDDSEAPSFTVLSDSEGNRVCICTILDRA
ncbi:MAG TPA: VOC family protein [Ornithinibacter sp.]|nr:VOC family protein [Ornithinibacter sp.]